MFYYIDSIIVHLYYNRHLIIDDENILFSLERSDRFLKIACKPAGQSSSNNSTRGIGDWVLGLLTTIVVYKASGSNDLPYFLSSST